MLKNSAIPSTALPSYSFYCAILTESSGSTISLVSNPFLLFVPVIAEPPGAAVLPFLGGPPA